VTEREMYLHPSVYPPHCGVRAMGPTGELNDGRPSASVAAGDSQF
jgi:hypothetical protein